MSNDINEDNRIYIVVKNDEDQFSIWFEGRDLPPGWFHVGKTGSKTECLAFIKTEWVDMRPASLRTQIASKAG